MCRSQLKAPGPHDSRPHVTPHWTAVALGGGDLTWQHPTNTPSPLRLACSCHPFIFISTPSPSQSAGTVQPEHRSLCALRDPIADTDTDPPTGPPRPSTRRGTCFWGERKTAKRDDRERRVPGRSNAVFSQHQKYHILHKVWFGSRSGAPARGRELCVDCGGIANVNCPCQRKLRRWESSMTWGALSLSLSEEPAGWCSRTHHRNGFQRLPLPPPALCSGKPNQEWRAGAVWTVSGPETGPATPIGTTHLPMHQSLQPGAPPQPDSSMGDNKQLSDREHDRGKRAHMHGERKRQIMTS
uniref:Uncharacterized protein n=1 Tax=Knipowitschia caucasica TaxID=637954 RepID=A0AAV2K2B2_KNICA